MERKNKERQEAETAKHLEQWIEREEANRLEELQVFQQAEWLERERREQDNRLMEARLEAQRDVEELVEEDRVAVQYVLDTEDQSIITTSQWLDREKHQEELDRLKNVIIGYDPDNEIENRIIRYGMEGGGNSIMEDGDTDMQRHGTEDGGNGTMDDGDTDMQGHGTEDGGNGMTDKGDTDMQGHAQKMEEMVQWTRVTLICKDMAQKMEGMVRWTRMTLKWKDMAQMEGMV